MTIANERGEAHAVNVRRAEPDVASARLKAIGLMSAAVMCFAALDTSGKLLTRELDTIQIVWGRYTAHFLIALVLFNPFGAPGVFRSHNWPQELFRAALLFGSTATNFFALRYLQLDETTSIIFATPLLVALLAGPLLGEWVGPRRLAAIGVGFLGVVLVLRPGLGGLHWAASFSVLGMVCYALYSITTRKLAQVDSAATMVLLSALVPALALTPAMPFVWRMPEHATSWLLLAGTGLFGAVGHWLLTVAHRLAPASILMPFTYSQILWVVLLSYVVFHDVPSATTLLGAGIVIASGLYLLYRERVRRGA